MAIHTLWRKASLFKKASVLALGGGVTLISFCLITLPSVSELKHVRMQVPLKIYTSDNQLIATFGEKKRFPVSIDEIPIDMQHAFIAAEDQRFYRHHGVDYLGLARATGALIVKRGHITQGASTITMQVARNFFLSRHKTFARKFNEILLALKIERALDKNKILELYLNKIYLGERAYGVSAASQIYYAKNLNQLNLSQIAMLAGLPKAPSANNPINNPVRALKRRNYVLERMFTLGYITQAQRDQAQDEPITASFHGTKIAVEAPYVAEMARHAIVKLIGDDAYTDGYNVVTTLDSHHQKNARHALRSGLILYTERHGFTGPILHIDPDMWSEALKVIPKVALFQPALVLRTDNQTATVLLPDNETEVDLNWDHLQWARKRLKNGYTSKPPTTASEILRPGDVVYVRRSRHQWRLSQLPKVQGAIVALDPHSGAILALSGGFDYSLSAYNRAIQAQRQAGSVFKPFIYAAALDNGMTLASIFNDAPIVIADDSSTSAWRPHNSTQQFHGPTRLREGLIHSRNLVSVRLLQAIGIPKTIDFLKRFQFSPEALPDTLSLALGSGSVTPMEITRAYASFANGGALIKPHFIARITNANGQLVYQAKPQQACQSCPNPAPQILTPDLAYLINNTMLDVIERGTGRQAKRLNRHDLGGKTGTTNDKQDAWFAGFNGDIVATVWVGYDAPKSLHEYGAQVALPIWINFMRHALEGKPESLLERPDNIVSIRIDADTGKPANHHSKHTLFELFRSGHV